MKDELWAVGSWLSAALDDPKVCAEMKADIREWFDSGGHLRSQPSVEEVARVIAMAIDVEDGVVTGFNEAARQINSMYEGKG